MAKYKYDKFQVVKYKYKYSLSNFKTLMSCNIHPMIMLN